MTEGSKPANIKPYEFSRICSFATAEGRRDAKIDGFFDKAGIRGSEALESDQKLYKDEVLNDKNYENPRASMLNKLFTKYASGKDDSGITYLTPDDVSRFVKETNGGTKEPQSAVAKKEDAPFSIFNLQKYQIGRQYVKD